MKLRLTKPNKDDVQATNKSSFVREAQQPPAKGAAKPTSFLLQPFYRNLIDEQSVETGQNRTVIVKAALLALESMDPNEKNHWLLEANRKK